MNIYSQPGVDIPCSNYEYHKFLDLLENYKRHIEKKT
jgi:hypothetical protein